MMLSHRLNKKSVVYLKFIIIFFILTTILFLLLKSSRADTTMNIINMTIKVTSSNISINISDVLYDFNNTNSNFSIQQNFSVSFEKNTINISSANITCTNSTFFVSCVCPQVSNFSANCSIPSEIDLKNSTKQEFLNSYTSVLGSKMEEASSKISHDIIFQLEPTKVLLDDYKQAAFNSSIKEQEAYRQRDSQLEVNKRIASELQNQLSEYKLLQVVFISFLTLIVISVAFYFGIWERKGKLF